MTPKTAIRAIEARRRFIAETRRPASPTSLTYAALAVAAEDFGSDIETYTQILDSWAATLTARLKDNPDLSVPLLNQFVFEDLGFQGNSENYYDPRNSFLSYVIDHRRGIPITLSLVYIHIAVAAGIEAYGIGMPGHFLVGVQDRGERMLVDCFNGRILDEDDCRQRLDELFSGRIDLKPDHLKRASSRAILIRLLANLKSAYGQCGLYRQAIGVIERILILEPGNRMEFLDRARFKAKAGKLNEALAGFESCLSQSASELDKLEIRKEMNELIKRMAERN